MTTQLYPSTPLPLLKQWLANIESLGSQGGKVLKERIKQAIEERERCKQFEAPVSEIWGLGKRCLNCGKLENEHDPI